MQQKPEKKCNARWDKLTKQVIDIGVDVDDPSSPPELQAKPGDTVTLPDGTTIKIPAELPPHTVIFTYTNPLICGWYLESGTYHYR